MDITILGRKEKEGGLIADFTPEESNSIIQDLTEYLEETLGDLEQETVEVKGRLKKVLVKAKDGSMKGEISHVSVDTFGEKHAEVRAVLNVQEASRSKVFDAFGDQHFTATVTS